MIGSEGGVLWLVAVLFLLTLGLAGALLAATRASMGPVRGDRPAGDTRRSS